MIADYHCTAAAFEVQDVWLEACGSYDPSLVLPQSRGVAHPIVEGRYKTPPKALLFYLPHRLMSALNSTILNSVAGEDNRLVTGLVGAAAILATTAVYQALRSKDEEHEFPKLRGIQLYHAWNFFRRRYDFIHSNFKRNFGQSFSFNVLHHNIIALTGEDARQAFFSNPHLSFYQGYRILMGAVRVYLTLTQ